jgi:hypothetical protein
MIKNIFYRTTVGNHDPRRASGIQFPAAADAELGEHLAQAPLDLPRRQEQLRADLRVRQAVAGQPGDLLLLGRVSSSRVPGFI